jgi:hypothetical protein
LRVFKPLQLKKGIRGAIIAPGDELDDFDNIVDALPLGSLMAS